MLGGLDVPAWQTNDERSRKKNTSYIPWETLHERSLCIFTAGIRLSSEFFFVLFCSRLLFLTSLLLFSWGFSLLLLLHPLTTTTTIKKREMMVEECSSLCGQVHTTIRLLKTFQFSIVLERKTLQSKMDKFGRLVFFSADLVGLFGGLAKNTPADLVPLFGGPSADKPKTSCYLWNVEFRIV